MNRRTSTGNATESEGEQIRIAIAGRRLRPPSKAEKRGPAWQLQFVTSARLKCRVQKGSFKASTTSRATIGLSLDCKEP